MRIGLHTGEVELRGDDIGGISVHLAARLQEQAGADEICVSRTVVELVAGSGIGFEDRGEHDLKGVPDLRASVVVSTTRCTSPGTGFEPALAPFVATGRELLGRRATRPRSRASRSVFT